MRFKLPKHLFKKSGSKTLVKETAPSTIKSGDELIQSEKVESMVDYYDRLCDTQTDAARSVGWINDATQKVRFLNLTLLGNLDGKSLLDVGCGIGGLFKYLQDQEEDVEYTGIDVSSKMVQRARAENPGARFNAINFLSEEFTETFDYIVASGALSYPVKEPKVYIERVIHKMMMCANEAVAFNVLSNQAPQNLVMKRFMYFDPKEILDICFKITPYVELKHHYLPNDFTVCLYKH